MGKRARVPAALQSELSGYLSLLRAIKASSTLDLTSQLVSSSQVLPVNEDDGSVLEGSSSHRTASEGTSSQPALAEASPQLPGSTSSGDTWTRWPLLARDVPIPEWELKDEVRVITAQILGALDSGDLGAGPGLDETGNDEGQEDSLLSPTVLSALSGATSKFLTEILASMAELHRPVPHLSNRIRLYDWESVLSVVSKNGLIDNRKAQHVRRRMATVIGTIPAVVQSFASHPPVVSRALSQLQALNEDSLFVLEGFAPPRPTSSPKRSYRRKVTTRVQDDLPAGPSLERRKPSAGD